MNRTFLNAFKVVCFLNAFLFSKFSVFSQSNQDFSATSAARITVPHFKLNFSHDFAFSYKNQEFQFKDKGFSPKYGAEFSLFEKEFPFSLKIGHLSYSQSASLLKNPSPSSSISPLKSGFSSKSAVKSSIPGLSSGSASLTAVLSGFIETSVSEAKSKIPVKLNAALFENGNFYSSLDIKIPLFRKENPSSTSFIDFSATTGYTEIKTESETLKKAGGSFPEKKIFSFVFEILFFSPLIKIKNIAGGTQTPWKNSTSSILQNPQVAWNLPFAFWNRFIIQLSKGHFLLNSELYFCPSFKNSPASAVLVGSEGSIIRTIYSFSINPQVSFGKFSSGFSFSIQSKITSSTKPRQLELIALGTAFSWHGKILNSKTSVSLTNFLISGTPDPPSSAPDKCINISQNFSLPLKMTALSANLSWKNYPPITSSSAVKNSVSFSVTISPGIKRLLKISANCNFDFKNNTLSGRKLEAACNFKIPFKFLTLAGGIKWSIKN